MTTYAEIATAKDTNSQAVSEKLDTDFANSIIQNDFVTGTKTIFYSDVANAYDGDAVYLYYNIGNYCKVTNDGIVNKVRVKIKNLNAGFITYRIYIGETLNLTATPNSDFTLIEEIILKSSGNIDEFVTLNLTDSFNVTKDQYVYIFATTDRSLATTIKRWTDKPELGRIMFCTATSDIFNSAWAQGSSGYYITPPILELESYATLNLISPPNIQIPDTFYAVEGVEFNLYKNSICSNESYQITITSDCGVSQNERFYIKPILADVGTHEIKIEIYDTNFTLLLTKYISLIIQSSEELTSKNILIIGDSISAAYSGRIVSTIQANLAAMGGSTPSFIGTQGVSPANHEARAGWSYSTFIGSSSPFYNGGTVDIANYKTVNGYSSIDVIYIMLGTNGFVMADAKTLIAAFIANDANTKIIICPPPITADQDGFGSSYDSELNLNYISYRNKLFGYTEEIIDEFDNGKYNSNVSVGIGRYGISDKYGFPTETVAIADRITDTIERQSNSVHPNEEGSMQLGDAFTGSILNAII